MTKDVDILIAGGQVCDGSGADRSVRSVGITGDRISYIGPDDVPARQTIDASDLIVAPGFIDMHVHADLACLTDDRRDSQVFQGVTTEVIGQDGLGYAPMSSDIAPALIDALTAWNGVPPPEYESFTVEEYLAEIDRVSCLNAAYLVPHGTVRMHVMGMENRKATDIEIESMRDLVRDGLEAGAFGMSSGLTYAPGMYADDDELVRLNEVVREFDGIYVPHHRNYGSKALEAYAECIAIAERSGVRLHLTHAHLGFEANRGKAPDFLQMLEDASARGVRLSLDAYPYGPAATSLVALLPNWLLEKDRDTQVACLSDEATLNRIGREMEMFGTAGHMGEPIDWQRIVIASVGAVEYKRFSGHSIANSAKLMGVSEVHFMADLLIHDAFHTGVVVDIGNEENVEAIVTSRFHTGSSDGMFIGEKPHPRGFGSHARLVAQYVNRGPELRIEDMVRRLSGAPAEVLGLSDRGHIAVGQFADICIFDLAGFHDRASFESPRLLATGMQDVIVNGEPVLVRGRRTDAVPGSALRHRKRMEFSC